MFQIKQSSVTVNIKDWKIWHIPPAAKQRAVVVLWLACSSLVLIQANVSFYICPICWCVYVCYICTTRVYLWEQIYVHTLHIRLQLYCTYEVNVHTYYSHTHTVLFFMCPVCYCKLQITAYIGLDGHGCENHLILLTL